MHSWLLSHLVVLQLQLVLRMLPRYNSVDSSFVFLIRCVSAFFLAQIGFSQSKGFLLCQIGLATVIRYGFIFCFPNTLYKCILSCSDWIYQRRVFFCLSDWNGNSDPLWFDKKSFFTHSQWSRSPAA